MDQKAKWVLFCLIGNVQPYESFSENESCQDMVTWRLSDILVTSISMDSRN